VIPCRVIPYYSVLRFCAEDRMVAPTDTPMSAPLKAAFWFVAANALLGAISLIFLPTRTDTFFSGRSGRPLMQPSSGRSTWAALSL
jgi:hypothetical protein